MRRTRQMRLTSAQGNVSPGDHNLAAADYCSALGLAPSNASAAPARATARQGLSGGGAGRLGTFVRDVRDKPPMIGMTVMRAPRVGRPVSADLGLDEVAAEKADGCRPIRRCRSGRRRVDHRSPTPCS